MKIVMVMFDTLNRHHLPNYGCDWTVAPNMQRLGDRCVTFDRSYVGSMPCMPARCELHTGRPNFLHRSWGPLEPYHDSVFEILKEQGVYSHFTTDHYHYFEDGGLTYHNRYNTWQFNRGQEGDPWIGQVADPVYPKRVAPFEHRKARQDFINRQYMRHEHQHHQTQTFRDGMDFIRRNHDQDNWILQIETFDPHEPYFSAPRYKDLYADHYDRYEGKHWDWPIYAHRGDDVTEAEVEHLRYEYASLLSQCDANLGTILRQMDELSMWDDTMLIVWTDHGFFLGERDLLGKCWMPFFEEVSHTPFFVWDPRTRVRGERREALVQPAVDLAPTMLNFFGHAPTPDMTGKDLAPAIADDTPVRDVAMFGMHGGHVNATDGRYVYMRGPANDTNEPRFDFTRMPTHMANMFLPDELQNIELAEPFSFTKGCRLLKIPTSHNISRNKINHIRPDLPTLLFDLQNDPQQCHPLEDPGIEERMTDHMARLMRECDAPSEQYERLGIQSPTEMA